MFESNMSVTPARKRSKYSGSLEKGLLESLMKNKSPRICLLSVQGKSDVWSLFKRIVLDDEETRYVQCQECGNIMIHDNSTGTGGLKRHNCLPKQRKAMAQLVNAVGPLSVPWKKEIPLALNVSTTSKNTSNSKHQLQLSKPKLINSSIVSTADPLSVQLKKEVSKVGAFCIVKDLKPYNFMEGNGFELLAQNLINIGAKFGNIDAKQLLPNAMTISKSVSKIYEKLKDSLRDELKAIKILGLSCDSRISSSKFMTISVRYFKDGHLFKRFLGAIIVENETSDFFAKVKNIFEDFDITLKVKICVCENASLLLQSLNQYEWINCAVQNLKLVLLNTFNSIKDDPTLKPIHNLTHNIQQLIAFWKDNGFNETQVKLEPFANDPMDSIVDMLRSVSKHWIELMEIRERNERMKCYLDAIDKNLLNHLIKILKPFKELRETLCEENEPVFHLVLPTKAKLIKNCDLSASDELIIQKFKEKLKKNIESYFEVSIFHKCATLLVPSFRSLKNMANSYEKEEIFEMLKKLEQEWYKESSPSSNSTSNLFFKESHLIKNNALETIFDSLIDSESRGITNKQPPTSLFKETSSEVERYLKENLTCSELKISPMEFWELKKSCYPRLYEVAKCFLSTPASSCSSYNNLYLDFKNTLINLDVEKISQLFFIRSNMENL